MNMNPALSFDSFDAGIPRKIPLTVVALLVAESVLVTTLGPSASQRRGGHHECYGVFPGLQGRIVI